jgi:putative transposase
MIRCDNGPEFISHKLDMWCKDNHITLAFIQPGKPTQNTLIERFNGTYRKEVLNTHLFSNLNEVRDKTKEWMWVYNNTRPHESLNNKPPVKFRSQRSLDVPTYLIDKQLNRKTIFTTASH